MTNFGENWPRPRWHCRSRKSNALRDEAVRRSKDWEDKFASLTQESEEKLANVQRKSEAALAQAKREVQETTYALVANALSRDDQLAKRLADVAGGVAGALGSTASFSSESRADALDSAVVTIEDIGVRTRDMVIKAAKVLARLFLSMFPEDEVPATLGELVEFFSGEPDPLEDYSRAQTIAGSEAAFILALAHGVNKGVLEKAAEGTPKQPDGRDADLLPYAELANKLATTLSTLLEKMNSERAATPPEQAPAGASDKKREDARNAPNTANRVPNQPVLASDASGPNSKKTSRELKYLRERLKDSEARAKDLEKRLRGILADTAVLKAKAKAAVDREELILDELRKASSQLEYLRLDPRAEAEMVKNRLNALGTSDRASIWSDRARGHALMLLQVRVEHVKMFFQSCKQALVLVHNAFWPLRQTPEGLGALMQEFRSGTALKELVRRQLVRGAKLALGFVRVKYPQLALDRIHELPVQTGERPYFKCFLTP